MSLLDDVSIVVTPNGYKAGELYAVIPSNGNADMDVTRATAATRVDEDGLVNYAEVIGSDLVTNGDFATDLSGWSNKSSTSTWVSGSARVDNSIGNNNSGLFQDIGLILGKTYTLTATLKLISADSDGNFVVLTSNSIGSGQTIIYTGNALVIGGASVTETIEFTTSDSDVSIQLACNATNAVFEIDNVSVKEVTRNNVPRIDYTGGGCPHILSEPERKNLLPYSSDFTQWSPVGSPIISSNYGTSPDGTLNADRIQMETGDRLYEGSTTPNVSFSVYAKSNSGSTHTISMRDGGGVVSYDMVITDEWQRFDVYLNTTMSNVQFRSFEDDVDILMWGAQAEVGSYPTSYIPTSGSTVTRNQDIFTRDGIGSLINSTEGVLFVEMAALVDGGNFELISLSDGSNSNRCSVFFNGGNLTAAYRISNSNVFIHIEASDLLNFNKVAISYKQSQFKMFVNGYNVFEQLSGNVLPSNTFNKLSFDSGAGANPFYGKVKQLQVYNTALTDEQLLQLTGTSGTDFYESYAEMASALTYTIQ